MAKKEFIVIGDVLVKRRGVVETLSKIPKRESEIIKKYFGLCGRCEQSQVEIALDLKISNERVRQVINQGLGRLKRLLGKEIRGEV